MKKIIDISLKKQAKQERSIATVAALMQAATYILEHEGPRGFTANKVAEKAGVNIASFYQYFPNKEALLFHIAQMTWQVQLERLTPLLTLSGSAHADKLRKFIREFFMIEATEAGLRQSLRVAAIELKDTDEFNALISRGGELMRAFIAEATGTNDPQHLDFVVQFVVTLVTSFAERTTDERTSAPDLMRQADLISNMLVVQFKIP